MAKYTATEGTVFTDYDNEKPAEENEPGYTSVHFTLPCLGRSISIGEKSKPFAIPLDEYHRKQIKRIVDERNSTPSQVIRELRDSLL